MPVGELHGVGGGAVCADRDVDRQSFKVRLTEARYVVEQNARQDDAQLQLGLTHCTQPGCLYTQNT